MTQNDASQVAGSFLQPHQCVSVIRERLGLARFHCNQQLIHWIQISIAVDLLHTCAGACSSMETGFFSRLGSKRVEFRMKVNSDAT